MHKFRRNKMKARILSVILTVGMVLTMLPIAWANSAKASGSDLHYYTVATSSTSSTRAVRGVLDSYTDLPQYKYEQTNGAGSWKLLSVGTVNRPFLILEIVPQHEFAEFGYLIDGCEPIKLEELHTAWVVSDVNAFLGSYFDFKQSSSGAPGSENSAHFFLDEEESQGKYYSDRSRGDAGAAVSTPTLPQKTDVYKFEGYYERVADGKGNFVFDAATVSMKKQDNGDIVWHTINPWEKKYVNYTFAETSTMKEEYFDEVGDRYYTYRLGGPADPYVDAGAYYYFYKNRDPFVTDVVGLSAAMAPTYSVLVKTITPDELSSVQENDGFNWAEYADLIYINPKSHDRNYIEKWSLNWMEGTNRVYANRLGEAPHSSVDGFGTQDINFTIFKTIFERACAAENYVGLAFDYTMKDFTGKTAVNPKILDFNFQETYYNSNVRTLSSERGASTNIGKLWFMSFAQNMNITKKMFWDRDKIYEGGDGTAWMRCQTGNEAKIWAEGNFLLIDPDTSITENLGNDSSAYRADMWTSWNATGNINDNDYAFGHVYGYNGNTSLTQSFTTGKANISDGRFDEFSDYVKTDEGVRRAWESHNPGKDFDAEMGGKYAGNIAPSAALRYILGLGSAPSTSFNGTLHVLNVEPSVGVTSTYGQNWKTADKKVRLQMMLPNFMGDFDITSMTMGSFVGRTEDLSAYDLIYFGNDTDGFWKDDKGLTDFVDHNLDGRIYSHVGDLMVGGKLGRVANFVNMSGDEYGFAASATLAGVLDASQYSVDFIPQQDESWGGSAQLVIHNNSTKVLENWALGFDFGIHITGLYSDASITENSGNHYVASGRSDVKIQPGGSVTLTMQWGVARGSNVPSNFSLNYMETVSNLDANLKADWLRFPGNDITQLKIRELNEYMEGGHPVVAHTNLFDANLMDQASYIYNFLKDHHPASSGEATGSKRVFRFAESSEIEKAVRASKIEVTFEEAFPIRYDDQKSDDEKYLKKVGDRAYLQFKAKVDEAGAYGYRIYVDQDRNAKFESDEMEWHGDITGNYLDTGTQCSLTKEMVGFVQWRIEIYKKSNDKLMRSEEGCSAIQFSGAEETKNKIHVLQIIPDNESALNAKLTDDAYYDLYNGLNAFDITVDVIKYSNFSNCFKDTGFSFNMSSGISEANPSQTALEAVNTNFLSAEYVANDRDVEVKQHRLDYYNMIIVGFADAYGQQDLSNQYGAAEYLYYFAMNNQGSILFTHDNTSLYNTPGGTGYTANTMMRDLMGMNRYGVNSTNADSLRAGLAGNLEGYRNNLKSTIDGFTYDVPITYKDGKVVSVSQTQGFTINAMHKLGDPDNAEQKAYGFRFPYKYMAVDAKDGSSSLFKDYAKTTGDGTGFMRAANGGQEPVCATNRIVRLNQGQITEYPYNISPTINNIANTHSQWYQLNMEDPEVTVWYTLEYNGDPAYDSGSATVYSSLPQDASNNYYIYSKGNVFYSGVGHSKTDDSLEERKLFVNTMIAAYRPGAEPPAVEITNPERIWDAADSCYKIRVPKELENGCTYSVETIGNNDVRVRFKPIDVSLAEDIKIKIEYGGTVVGTIHPLNNPGVALTKDNADNCIHHLDNGEEYYFDFPKSQMNPSATINFTIWNEKVTTPGTTVLKIVPQPLFMLD